jgi:hypothetical protein
MWWHHEAMAQRAARWPIVQSKGFTPNESAENISSVCRAEKIAFGHGPGLGGGQEF